MKNIILITGILLIVVNTIIGLLISNYLLFNWLSVDAVLITNIILLYSLATDGNISNGFKISLLFVFSILCITSIVLAIKSPQLFKDNYYIIAFILILIGEVILYLIARNIKLINSK